MSNDYYNILGISKSASADEIKRAYRKKAHQYHPDKGGGDEAKFKEINEAYQVLGNPEKRARYDQFGAAGVGGAGAGQGGFGGQGAQGWNFDFGSGGFSGFSQGGFSGFGGLGDIFEEAFGQAFSTVQAEIEISPAQAVLGDKLKAKVGDQDLDITIPKGVQDGTTLRFAGKGNQTRRGTRGDLHLVIRIKMPSHPSAQEKELYEKLREIETTKRSRKSWWGF